MNINANFSEFQIQTNLQYKPLNFIQSFSNIQLCILPQSKQKLQDDKLQQIKNITHAKHISQSPHSGLISFKYSEKLEVGKTFFFFYTLLLNITLATGAISALNLQASSSTNLVYSVFDFTTYVPANSLLIITLPKQYSALDLFKNKPYSGYDSSTDFCPADSSCTGVTISYKGYNLVISGLFPTQITGIIMTYTIFNIVNPRYKCVTDNILVGIVSSDLLTTYYSQNNIGLTITAPELAYSVSLTSKYLWSQSPMTLTLTSSNSIKKFLITFPNRWENQTRVSKSILPSIFVQSNTHKISHSSTGQNVQIFDFLFTGGSLQSITLSISSIYTPSQVIDMGPIIISAYNSQGYVIQQTTFYIPKANLYTERLRQTSSSIVYDLLGQKITINVFFTIPQDSISSDSILITYPSTLPIASSSSSYTIIVNSAIMASNPTIYTENNSILISPFTFTYFQASVQISMVTNWPRTAVQTSNFSIQSIRLGTYFMQTAFCCSLYIVEKNSLLVGLSVTSQQRSKSSVIYTFQITHKATTLTSTDSLVIQFPAQYQSSISASLESTICSALLVTLPSNSSNINPGLGCSVKTNFLKISNFLLSANSPALIQVKISLTNPSSNTSEAFSIWSQDSSGLKIQSNYNTTITINSAVLTSMQITPSNYVTNKQANYQFKIGNVGNVSKNSAISVILPSDFNPPYYPLNCKVQAISTPCSIHQPSRTIKIILSNHILVTPINLIISLINPRSLQPTQPFQINIHDSTNNLMQTSSSLTSGLNVTMQTTTDFFIAKMSSDASSIAVQGKLDFVFVLPFYPKASQAFTLKIYLSPLNMFSLNSSSCLLDSIAYACSLDNSTFLQITLSSLILTSNLIEVTLVKILFALDSVIQASAIMYYQNGSLYSSIATQNNLTISSSKSVILSSYSITQSSYFMNQATTITLTISNVPATLKFDSVVIRIPSNYQSSSYLFTNPNNSTSILINPSGMLNPIQVNQQCITFFFSYMGEVVGISSPSSQYFTLQCDLPCRSCKGNVGVDRTYCGDCYQIADSSMKYFRMLSSRSPYGECASHCVAAQYLNATTLRCQPCNSTCRTCQMGSGSISGDGNKCLQCNANLYLLGSICYITCPAAYYMNDLICSACVENCELCSSLQVCSQCVSSHTLYSGTLFLIQVNTDFYVDQCFLFCPPGTIKTQITSTTFQCLPCPTNCIQCLTSFICLVCQTPFYLFNSQCIDSCPTASNFYPNLNSQCVVCDCAQCSFVSYNCTQCSGSLILDTSQNRCFSACQNGKYNNSVVCSSCPDNCSVCLSNNVCTICQESFSLYKVNSSYSSCQSSCPSTTVLTIQILSPVTYVLSCLTCLSNCLTCALSQTFCLSCSSGFVFLNNSCLNACPAPFWNISKFCKICAVQCQTCLTTNPYNCSQCSQGYYLSNHTCYDACPVLTYPSISSKKCLSCQLLCQTCLNSTSCTSCVQGYYLFTNNLCYSSCPTIPTFYYTYKGQCTLCQPQCTSCLSTPVQCASCSSSIYYFNVETKQCNTTCLDPYFINGSKCVKCQPPCSQCDTSFNSCSQCSSTSNLAYLYRGSCLNVCPQGYYPKTISSTNYSCQICTFPCLTCSQSQCKTCESFSFMYRTTCVLDCSVYSDMPFSKDSYCTNCLSIPFCTICQLSQTQTFQCFSCTYPYVVFQGACLNNCPKNYLINNQVDRKCVQSQSYLFQTLQEYLNNKPTLPFQFLTIGVMLIILIYPITNSLYQYSYNVGYMIFVMNLFDYILAYWWLLQQSQSYNGQYADGAQQSVPSILVGVYLLFNLAILGWICFGIWALKLCYLTDQRYKQWKCQHQNNFKVFLIVFALFGPKSHKLYYSKLFGSQNFAYRIISVQKFQVQDRINFISCFVDLIQVFAFAIVTYNVFIQYSVLYLVGIQVLAIKIIIWILLILDSRKPDRGFFMGDQKQALQEMKMEQIQQSALLRRINTDTLIKMIRKKSAILFNYNSTPFGQLDKIQFLSVYNPDDYQDVIKVPNKKIQKNIEKGKFRRGRKITIQERLQRFADSIKPKPKILKDQSFLKGLIYWKPPKKLKIQSQNSDKKMSQQQMLRILQNKQRQYKNDLDQISQIVFDEKSQISPKFDKGNFKTGQYFFGTDHLGSYNQLQQSIQHYEEGSIEDLSSQIIKFDQIEYNDLMNVNYAKKKHLPRKQKKPNFDDNQMRILYHEPMKKRRNKLQ